MFFSPLPGPFPSGFILTKYFLKINKLALARLNKMLYYSGDASVAQWIEQWPPEPRA